MTGIITQPRTRVQCVVAGGGDALPASKFGSFTSNGNSRRPGGSRGASRALLPSQPASQTSPPHKPTGPGPGVWERIPPSPQVSGEVGYTTFPGARLCLLANLSPAAVSAHFPGSAGSGQEGQLLTIPLRERLPSLWPPLFHPVSRSLPCTSRLPLFPELPWKPLACTTQTLLDPWSTRL